METTFKNSKAVSAGKNAKPCRIIQNLYKQAVEKFQGQDLQRVKRGCGELIFLTSTRLSEQ